MNTNSFYLKILCFKQASTQSLLFPPLGNESIYQSIKLIKKTLSAVGALLKRSGASTGLQCLVEFISHSKTPMSWLQNSLTLSFWGEITKKL